MGFSINQKKKLWGSPKPGIFDVSGAPGNRNQVVPPLILETEQSPIASINGFLFTELHYRRTCETFLFEKMNGLSIWDRSSS